MAYSVVRIDEIEGSGRAAPRASSAAGPEHDERESGQERGPL
jgi:hypothetical protein